MLVALDFMIGGAVCALPVWLLSRFMLRASRDWFTELDRLILAHGVTWILCGLVATTLLPAFAPDYAVRATLILTFPQACLLVIDLAHWRHPLVPQGAGGAD